MLPGMLGNPYISTGMGILAGNQGETGNVAFSNAMRSGLQSMNTAAQFGLLQQMHELEREKRQQEIDERTERLERRRKLEELMSDPGYMSAPRASQRQMVGQILPESMAKGLLATSEDEIALQRAKTAALLAEASYNQRRPTVTAKAPISLMDPNSFQQVSLRPDDPRVDQYLDRGFVRVGLGLQGQTPTDIFPGSTTQMGQAVQQLGFMEDLATEMDTWIASIESDPSLVGPVGGLRSMGQTALGVTEDMTALASPEFANKLKTFTENALMSGAADDMPAEERQRLFTDERLSRRKLFENRLGLALARLQYGEGRIPVEVIRRSIGDARMTGLTSSRQVLSRLRDIRGRVSSNIEQLNWRLEGGPSGRTEGRATHPETGETMIKIGGKWYRESEAQRRGMLR